MGTRTVNFSVTGEFVTRTAREWLWMEGKPWPVVEELLLNCMCGTDKSKEELVELATKVVIGRAKFIGNTGDGSYALTDDNQDLTGKYIAQWSKQLAEAKKELREIEDKYITLVNYLIDNGKGHILSEAGVEEEDENPVVSAMLDSFMKQNAIEREGHTDNYGWIDPGGKFYPVQFAEHQMWAHKKVVELGLVGENADSWTDKDGEKHYLRRGDEGDILVKHGWALLHNPGRGIALVTASEEKPLTKAQREFLYGYYSDRGLWEQAEQYLEE